MRKIATAGVVAVLGVGVGIIGYSLIRTTGQIGRIGADVTAPAREEPARVTEPPAAQPSAAPAAVAAPEAPPVADTADEQSSDALTADERSPFGHAGKEQIQPDHETTLAEGAPREATGDATSMTPLLADAHATLTQLLADAKNDPEAKAEIAALLGNDTPFDALLENPDPKVREEAAKLLEALGRSAEQ